MIIYWKEQNQQKQNKFWKITQNRPVTTRQNPILEPKETAIQISVYRSFYYVLVPKPLVWSVCGRI
jgi:hypothetical protein